MKRTIALLVFGTCIVNSVWADPTIESVQQALKRQKFYYGKITGQKNADTTAAIRRYQIRNGLQVSGEFDSETLRSLNIDSNSLSQSKPAIAQSNGVRPDENSKLAQNSSPPASEREAHGQFDANASYSSAYYNPALSRVSKRMAIAELQRQLISSGYFRGSADGRYGRRTALALRAFQFSTGLSPTGYPDASTLNALGLPDQNLASAQTASRPNETWVPITKWKHGKWKVKWKKYQRDEDTQYSDADRSDYGNTVGDADNYNH